MNGDGDDCKRRRPQHHGGERGAALRRGEFGQIFGMAGVTKTCAIKHVLGDRIGHDRACVPSHDIGHSLADRGQGRARAGVVGMTGAGGCNVTGGHNRQGIGKYLAGIVGANLGKPDFQAKFSRPAFERRNIAEPIEGGQFEFVTPEPGLERDVGPDARGFARCQRERLCHIRQRYSIIAALRTSCKYDFDFASYFSLYIFSRTSLFLGESTVVGSLPHNTTISTPCFVISGGVRWPIGVLSSTSLSTCGMSAEVLVTASRMAAFCIDLKNTFASAQVWIRARNASASFLRVSITSGPEPRGTMSTIGCILYSKLGVSDFCSPPCSLTICSTSFSPTWRLSLYRPRTRLLQTMSALIRALSVSGRMPWLSSDFVNCSVEMRIRPLIAA